MNAVQIDAYGGPENMVLRNIVTPEPGPGEALVRIEYAGVNYTDVYNRNGMYAKSHTYANTPPFTLGREGGGVVERLAADVDSVAAGDRVAYCLPLGSYAEAAVVPAWRLVKIPDAVDTPTATALMLQGCTAHYLTHSLFRMKPGMRCLVHAAAGGVGQFLVALAKHLGAEVFATVGSEEKARIAASLGADHVILYRREAFASRVRELTRGRGVDVVYDSVGRATIEGSMRSLAPRGTLVNFGSRVRRGAVHRAARSGRGGVTLLHPAAHGRLHARRRRDRMAWALDVRASHRRARRDHHRPHSPARRRGRGPSDARGARDAGQAAVADRLRRAAAGPTRTSRPPEPELLSLAAVFLSIARAGILRTTMRLGQTKRRFAPVRDTSNSRTAAHGTWLPHRAHLFNIQYDVQQRLTV